ncbi:hypothetical protein GEU84_013665 [Fertoebacter nigrum]|uniref:Uncharacterized protein n=1 Tax=Fertoeibacter niger TaxID=2656921 RepID=A0A8X8KQ04_9RHOB|nr:hypothetical protein [Fertoeibacter niger]NUB45441.1 hypothetical protein [Fertoeibacter niger]
MQGGVPISGRPPLTFCRWFLALKIISAGKIIHHKSLKNIGNPSGLLNYSVHHSNIFEQIDKLSMDHLVYGRRMPEAVGE